MFDIIRMMPKFMPPATTDEVAMTASAHVPRQFSATNGLREIVLEALHKAGGSDYLALVARDSPAVFCSLIGKLLPPLTAVTISTGAEVDDTVRALQISFVQPGDDVHTVN